MHEWFYEARALPVFDGRIQYIGDAVNSVPFLIKRYTEKATKAWHRHERQKEWHTQKHHQTIHAATEEPTNSTKTLTAVI